MNARTPESGPAADLYTLFQQIDQTLGRMQERIADIEDSIARQEGPCMLRALESVAGAEASRDEWNMLARTHRQVVDHFVQYGEEKAEVFDGAGKMYHDLTIAVSKRDTPLGKALRMFAITYEFMTPPQMREKIKAGGQIVILGDFIFQRDMLEGNLQIHGHATHLGMTEEGLLYWKNWGPPTMYMFAPAEDEFRVIVFMPINAV